ncbi:benzoate-CoA ligase family protein [Noviherbaspirillum saxi]|uniref:Benzoate-CoA ligase family protein n=1 Tax=Noviherbaspirillum saxi TaxID=2320863 RepID=A0A3A3G3I0_9BURK|nr:benzoate-CoA ligase family protein [Noviherbaspirillum saxi]RJF95966.1 benzoate-CoA ligase family protein [Noviherbaspirillum saxi]
MNETAYTDSFARDHLPPREQWPELLFDLPELQYPQRLNCAIELLDKMVTSGSAGKPALIHRSMSWTYAELLDKVNRIAAVLREDMHLVPGNRVLLRGANHPMLAAAILAVWKAGCIAVPTMPLLRAPELSVIIDKAQINAALCAACLKDELELAREQSPVLGQVVYYQDAGHDSLEQLMQSKSGSFEATDTCAEDVCLIAFTSGTTGKPKGAMHFHRDILAVCDTFPRSILQSRPEDVFIGTPPLAFTFGLGGLLLFPLRVGASTVLLEKLTPETLMQAIEEFRPTVCFTAPTFYRQMAPLASRHDISSLKKTVSAGEALPVATRESWQRATDIAMVDGIGSTEMLHIFISASGNTIRPGATGKPVPGYRACVLDEDGNPAGPGVVGRLAVKGPTGCRYLSDPRQADYVYDGWNLTGDAYEIDADGYFWYRARTDDMIISAGYNIAGPEVEDALLKHPAVAECAVIGVPDEERGQIVKAFVVLKQGIASDDEMTKQLQAFVKQSIAPYKYPRAVEYRTSLPRTETGKLQRFKLRQGIV